MLIGAAPPSNKPGLPSPEPNKHLFPTKLFDPDGNPAWVSLPQPDKLTVVGSVTPEHFAEGFGEVPEGQLAAWVMSRLATGKAGQIIGSPHFTSGVYRTVTLAFGSMSSAVNFTIGRTKGSQWFRIECNPSRLGAEGIFDLVEGIKAATKYQFDLRRFLRDARVTRLDVAVDVVGLRIRDLLVTADKEGKRVHYYGEDGVLETVYIHRRTKKAGGNPQSPLKPSRPRLGALIARLYDKRRELIAAGIGPAFGPAEVTRVEVSKTRFGNKKVRLIDLATLPNLFASIKVGHVRNAVARFTWTWMKYVELRRGGGHDWAIALMNVSPLEGKKFAQAYLHHPSDVVKSGAVWAGWSAGLVATGCDHLIELATPTTPEID